MRKKRAGKIGIALLATGALLVSVSGLTGYQARAADSTDLGFAQEVLIVDKSDGAHTQGVPTPDMQITYRLTPVVGVTSNDSRYAENLSLFPDGTLEDGTGVIEYTQPFTSGTSDANGVVSYNVPIGNIFKNDQAKFGENSKVYRYNIEIVGVYLKNKDGSDWSATNILNSPNSGIEVPTTAPLMDVNVDTTGNISGIAMWDASGTTKLEGFTADASATTAWLGNPFTMTASAASESNAIEVTTYDVKLSSDYIGNNWSSIHGGISYSITFKNLPDYITKGNMEDLIPNGNNRSWKNTTAADATDKTLSGTLDMNGEIVFQGIPVTDTEGTPVTYSATLDFAGLEHAKDASGKDTDLRSTYAPGIFYGVTADRVEGVTSMSGFSSSAYAASYKYEAYDSTVNMRTTDPAFVGEGQANAARFLIFDPEELVVVGVAEHTKPALLLILSAAMILVLLALSRRKEKEISDFTWR